MADKYVLSRSQFTLLYYLDSLTGASRGSVDHVTDECLRSRYRRHCRRYSTHRNSRKWQLAELLYSATDAAVTVKHVLLSVVVIPRQKINPVLTHCSAHCTESSGYSVLSKLLTYIKESILRISGCGSTDVWILHATNIVKIFLEWNTAFKFAQLKNF